MLSPAETLYERRERLLDEEDDALRRKIADLLGYKGLMGERDEALEANGRLGATREAIEAAPHYAYCSVTYHGPYGKLTAEPISICNCWKSRALTQLDAPKES